MGWSRKEAEEGQVMGQEEASGQPRTAGPKASMDTTSPRGAPVSGGWLEGLSWVRQAWDVLGTFPEDGRLAVCSRGLGKGPKLWI